MSDEDFLSAVMQRVPCRLRTYRADGHLMVGYGHDLTECPAWGIVAGDKICHAWAKKLLRMDMERLGHAALAEKLGVEL